MSESSARPPSRAGADDDGDCPTEQRPPRPQPTRANSSASLVSSARPPVPGGGGGGGGGEPARARGTRPIAVPTNMSSEYSDDDDDDDDDLIGDDDDNVESVFDDEEDAVLQAYPGSQSSSSGFSAPDSWRGVPPPMLASSFDARFRPILRSQPSPSASTASLLRAELEAGSRYGALDHDDADASASRRRPRSTPAEVAPENADIVSPPSASAHGVLLEARFGADDQRHVGPGRQVAVVSGTEQLEIPARTRTGATRADRSGRPRLHAVRHNQGHRSHHQHVSSPWRAKLSKLLVQWRAILHAPRELWIIFILKFLSSYAYFALSLVLTMFLTEEFGLSDTAAGWAYGIYGVMSTLFGFACGWIIDYLGVRVSLLLGGAIGAASRLILALTPSHRTAKLMLYTALPFSECMGIPIMTIGIKRYTSSHNRTFAFSLFYSMMNVAALVVGPVVDMARRRVSSPVVLDLRAVGFEAIFELSGLRIIVLSSAIAAAAMMLGVLAGIREIEVDEHGNVSSFEPDRSDPMSQTMSVLRDRAFWRLTVFTLLIVGVRLVFRHLDATLPKYLVRQFGPNAPFGAIYAINPFLVVWLVPLIGLFTRSVNSFAMILAGSFVSALSPFWVCVGPHYWTVILFMVTLSVGEAIYSPRVYEYTMEIAGRGSEGLYSSLSSAPLFSVKLLVGGMSGWLLTSFMPADQPDARNGTMMWAIIGATSLSSPLVMFALRNYLAPPDEESAQTAKRVAGSGSDAGAVVYIPIAQADDVARPTAKSELPPASPPRPADEDRDEGAPLLLPRDPFMKSPPRRSSDARTC